MASWFKFRTAGREFGALRHLETALAVGAPGNDPELLTQARIRHQFDGGDLPKLEPPRDRRHRPARRAMGVDSGSGPWPPPVRLIHHLACTGGTLISRFGSRPADTETQIELFLA